MKLVIDIPDELYRQVKDPSVEGGYIATECYNAIYRGIPLDRFLEAYNYRDEELDFVQPHKKVSVNLEVCKMREATQKEREGVEQYIDSIAEPCENAQPKYEDIAKAFQFGVAFGFGKRYDEMDKIMDEIKKVSTPQPKTGHWIRELIRNEKGGCIGAKMICSECGNDNKHDEYMTYCPNCGTKMIKPQAGSERDEHMTADELAELFTESED